MLGGFDRSKYPSRERTGQFRLGYVHQALSNARFVSLDRFSTYFQMGGDFHQSVAVGKQFQDLFFALA